jgi:hypothetical protein
LGRRMSAAARSIGTIRGRRISFGTKPGQKYRNIPTEVDGEKFHSKKEAKRWVDLGILQLAGRVRKLRRQVPFDLKVDGFLICRYIADFVYEEDTTGVWQTVVEDSKGYPTQIYRLKRKLMEAVHGIEIRET